LLDRDEDPAVPEIVSRSVEANPVSFALPFSSLILGFVALAALDGPAIADKLDGASIPTGAVYACVTGSGKARTIRTIDLPEKAASLCRRHTEMGPCQSARNACRNSGGRVYAADGTEITRIDEAEYDKKVMRVRVGQ
jgi:hypothetical protein